MSARTVVAFGLTLATDAALAHPGHGAGGWLSAAWSHLLSEPDHLAAILMPLLAGLAYLAWRDWAAWRATKSTSASENGSF
jgi:hydrogenase/urease accessory protein HupE